VRSYNGYLCLMQITIIGSSGHIVANYIIDAKLLRDKILQYLEPIFESTKILKVFHGCLHSDISWLHRDFGMIVLNVFDT
jgi:ribonuclease D